MTEHAGEKIDTLGKKLLVLAMKTFFAIWSVAMILSSVWDAIVNLRWR
jgi:hypothetical protein